jgi:tetratricopeptide (TPR) repeat protein
VASVANYNLKKLIVLILLTSVLSSCKTGGVGRSFFSASNSEKKIANDLKFIDAIAEKNTGNYEKSIVLFEEILKSKDNPAPAHFELSKLYWQKSNDDKAIQHINSAVDLNPKNKWFVNYKIELTKKLALYDECEKTYKLRKKLFPSSTDYVLNRFIIITFLPVQF